MYPKEIISSYLKNEIHLFIPRRFEQAASVK